MSDTAALQGAWSARALDVARASAIFTGIAATLSTAAASLGAFVFLVALIGSGRLHVVLAEAWRSPVGKAAVVFLAWVLASSAWSAAGLDAGLRDFWAWRKLVYLYLALPLFADAKWKRRAAASLLQVCVAAVALSFLSIVLDVPFRHAELGASGVVFTNYSIQGIAFAVAAAVAVQFATEARDARRRLYVVAAAALVANVLFFGEGRTAYLVIVGIAVCWAVLRGGLRHAAVASAAFATLLAAAFFFSPTFHGRVMKGWDEFQASARLREETSVGVRVLFAKNTVALIADRPVFGYGLGSFKPVYARYVDARYTGFAALHAGDPHDQYLYVLFEQGLVGLALFLGMIVVWFRSFPRDGYGRLAACALTAWVIGCIFNSHFRTFPEGHFYALFIAMLGAGAARRVRVSDPA